MYHGQTMILSIYIQVVPPDSKLQPSGSFPGHELHGGLVTLSPHLRWLASCSPDGKILLRAVGALVRVHCYFLLHLAFLLALLWCQPCVF